MKNIRIHLVQHEHYEAPGALLNWAKERNYSLSFSKVFAQEPLPLTLDKIDLLVVVGGPQSTQTTLEECPYFDASAEMKLIQNCVHAGKAVVGICLGAQLISAAFGAKSEPSPKKEIGIFPIALTNDGKLDEKISHFGSPLLVGHWHNDMPGLTKDCKILAESKGCPRQIIAYTSLVYGFQCHMEFTPETVPLLIAEEGLDFFEETSERFVQKPAEILNADYKKMNATFFRFLDLLISDYLGKN